jgi:predicted DNA-binding transcriptional regulator AlpA
LASTLVALLLAQRASAPEHDMLDSNHTTDRKLTTEEAAQYLGGLKRNTLERWRTFGKGPRFLKLDNHLVRYAKSDLDAWLEARKFTSTAQYDTHQVAPKRMPQQPKPLGPVQQKRAALWAAQANPANPIPA